MRRFEAQYQVLFEHNPQPMWVYDLESLAFLAVNEATIQHYGYSRAEFLQKTLFDISPPEEIRRLREVLPKEHQTEYGFVRVGTWKHLKKDGTLIEVDVSTEPVIYADKEARLALLNDITELRRSIEQLRLLEASVARLNDIVMITEAEPIEEPGPCIVFVNEAFTRRTGYSREETLGKNPRFLRGPKTSEETVQHIIQALEEKRPAREEVIIYTKSGEPIWWETEISPVFDGQGKCTHFVSIERDITERKKAEQALRQSEVRLKEAQRVATIGSWEWNISERKVVWSDEMFRIFGYQPQEFLITVETFLNCLHPDDQEMMRHKVDDMREHAQPFVESYRIVRPDGTVRFIYAQGEVVEESKGKPIKLMGTVQDITDRRLAEEGRLQTAKLEAANKELEAFSYSVSHDLRAPLRSIDGFSRMLLEDYADKLDDTGKSYLQFILQGTTRMSHLIQDLLSLSRVASSQIHRTRFDLSAEVASVVEELKQSDPQRKVEFKIQPKLMVFADQRLMRIVMENLLRNAWKFTGKVPVTHIEFGMFIKDAEQIYFVRDNGAGFDMSMAGKLFGVFQRLHPESQFGGTGVGLATVHRIISRHGGRTWGEGQVNKGATFYFTVPAK